MVRNTISLSIGLVLLLTITMIPAPVSGTDVTYSFVHLGDLQQLSSGYPRVLNETFLRIDSLKSQYNISAIFISGDETNAFDGGSSPEHDFPSYTNAIKLTTVPVYEITGNHDVYAIGDYTDWDYYIPNGAQKHNYGFVFNDFIVYALGWNGGSSLNPSAKSAMVSAIDNNPSKTPLILTHAYFDYSEWVNGTRYPIGNETLNTLSRSSIILSGHCHNETSTGLIRQISYLDRTYIEDLVDYEEYEPHPQSGGRLYNITSDGTQITNITVSDLLLYPDFKCTKPGILYPDITDTSHRRIHGDTDLPQRPVYRCIDRSCSALLCLEFRGRQHLDPAKPGTYLCNCRYLFR